MRIKDPVLFTQLNKELIKFSNKKSLLVGINSETSRNVFIMQLIDSIRRVKYVFTICERNVSKNSADPCSIYFNPLKAAILFKRNEMIDEAFWLIFLFVHFGKHKASGWRLVRDIYGALGSTNHWSWQNITSDPYAFKNWLKSNYDSMRSDGITRNFGNHRKYESLNPDYPRGTAAVFASYINWVNPPNTHISLIQDSIEKVGNNPRSIFNHLYKSMNSIMSFGRLAKFDYLTMIAKMSLAQIEPGSIFLQGATGPAKGAKLLFYGNSEIDVSCSVLEDRIAALESQLSIGQLGMQVLEDAICNWQKAPQHYRYFAG